MKILAGAICAALLGFGANAATINFSASGTLSGGPLVQVPAVGLPADWSLSFSIDDSAVPISDDGTFATYEVTPSSNPNINFSLNGSSVSLNETPNLDSRMVLSANTISFIARFDPTDPLFSGSVATSGLLSVTFDGANFISDRADLSTLNLPLALSAINQGFSSGLVFRDGNEFLTTSAISSGNLSVTTVAPVPLPAGGLLLLSGLVGVLGVNRWKKRTA
ncbi:hypothetical protein [Ruegeria sp. ANG-R]|uniref:hypothetical protein n=1 Tax=Ruegeria sp. ANG-R TaxID=1577903 RepID=UPI00126A4595|nr:hypothetical protein [Ruegeria sp. ANG-R]